MNECVAKEFVVFYYNCLNSGNFETLKPYITNHSTYIRNHKTFKGVDDIRVNCFLYPHKYTVNIENVDVLLNGDRRANIMVSGYINDLYYFTEYIHFAYSNSKTFWVHSSILHVNTR